MSELKLTVEITAWQIATEIDRMDIGHEMRDFVSDLLCALPLASRDAFAAHVANILPEILRG